MQLSTVLFITVTYFSSPQNCGSYRGYIANPGMYCRHLAQYAFMLPDREQRERTNRPQTW